MKTRAYVWPFAAFMIGLVLLTVADMAVGWDHPDAPWWRREPEQWIYPLQILICAILLLKYRRIYEFGQLSKIAWGVLAGVVGIAFWCLPTMVFDWMGFSSDDEVPLWMSRLGVAARTEGFNPANVFAEGGAAYWISLVLRFIRAAVVVAFVEELFWRGFLMRFVMDPDGKYWRQDFGRPAWRSFLIVTGAFMAIHAPVDWAGALVFGSLAYLVTVKTKSLGAVVAMHATANLIMGLFAMTYGKFGLW